MIRHALKFPGEWKIRRIQNVFDQDGVFEMIVSGPDFPEVSEIAVIPEVTVEWHKELAERRLPRYKGWWEVMGKPK